MKLKQNHPFTLLGMMFSISRQTCARYFRKMIKILRVVLKNFIFLESRESIDANIPRHFIRYRMVKYILDCTEIPVCSVKCICCRTQMFLYYKSRLTLKLLLGVSPSGLITYVSPLYGSKASDKFIFNAGNLLDTCSQNDAIMVDKGVHIKEECKRRGVKLIQPPFKPRKSKFNRR